MIEDIREREKRRKKDLLEKSASHTRSIVDRYVFSSTSPCLHADGHEIGGLVLNPSVNQKVFLQMLRVLIRSKIPYNVVHRKTKVSLVPNLRYLVRRYVTDSQAVTHLPKGRTGKITVTDECSYLRALSIANTSPNRLV